MGFSFKVWFFLGFTSRGLDFIHHSLIADEPQPQTNRSIDQLLEEGESGSQGMDGLTKKGKRRPQDNLEKGIFGAANKACSNCEKIPFAIFINNGTDIDRLGENIVQRDLDIGRHNVSMTQKETDFKTWNLP